MAIRAVSPSNERPTSGVALTLLGGASGLVLLLVSFRGVDPGRIWALIAELGGPSVLLLLLPAILSVGLESVGFQRALGVIGFTLPIAQLFRVRVAADALGNVLPMGAVLVEALRPKLLERQAGVPMAAGIAGIAARKYLLVLSQSAYLAIGFCAGGAALRGGLERLGAPSGLAAAPLVAAFVLALAASGMACALGGGTALGRALDRLARVPSGRLRAALARWKGDLLRTDETLSVFFRTGWLTRGTILGFYVVAWLLEATETWVILRTLGTSVGWGEAVGIEALVMLARNVLVMLPGGLGAQELGYATLLAGVGVDPGVSAAFALLKRARELLWVLAGFALLGGDRWSARSPTRPPREAPALLEVAS